MLLPEPAMMRGLRVCRCTTEASWRDRILWRARRADAEHPARCRRALEPRRAASLRANAATEEPGLGLSTDRDYPEKGKHPHKPHDREERPPEALDHQHSPCPEIYQLTKGK